MSCNILFSTVWLSSVLRYSFSAKTAMAFHHSRKLSGLSALFRLGCSGNRNGRKIRCLLAATESPSWIMKENDGTVGGYAFGSFLEEHSGMSPFLEPMKIRFENCGSIVSGSSGGKSLPYKKTSESTPVISYVVISVVWIQDRLHRNRVQPVFAEGGSDEIPRRSLFPAYFRMTNLFS